MPHFEAGRAMYELASELFPINRSLTGPGVVKTLAILQREIPELQIHAVESGTHCFDWTVPLEWHAREAYILDPDGNKILDFKENNLHLLGFSHAVDVELPLEELKQHLYSLEKQPDAIPYLTSYYKEAWGFCLSHNQLTSLRPGNYRAVIDATKKAGVMNYGEFILPGKTNREILLSCNICHPSLANNELSGPCLLTRLAQTLSAEQNRKYTYRFVFVPETIGAIAFLHRNLAHLKQHVDAGYVVTCVGDNGDYSYIPSRKENTLADRTLTHVLKHMAPDFKRYRYLDRGSDERQYCSPGVDLPIAVFTRSKFGTYPEYHTSLDNLSFISAEGFAGSFEVLLNCIRCLECNETLIAAQPCEPMYGKRGLYPAIGASNTKTFETIRRMVNAAAYCDGTLDILGVAEEIDAFLLDFSDIVQSLKRSDILHPIQKNKDNS